MAITGTQVTDSRNSIVTPRINIDAALNALINYLIPPTISAFTVTPSTNTSGQPFIISYTVSDGGGSGLNHVVLRRTSGNGSASDLGWQDIKSNIVSGSGPTSGSFTDTPPNVGTYWYGVAVFDNTGNSEDERQAGLGPKQVTVTAPPVVAQLASLSISGVATIIENGTGSFTATAHFSDSSTSSAPATWSVSGSVASINQSTGQLTAGAVSADTQVTVSASYTTGGITKTASANVTIVNSGGGGTQTQELITNDSFSSGISGWTQQGVDSWAGTNLTNYRTSPGYAALGVDSTGTPKNSADGALYQTVSIPPNATTATLSFWYYITTNETSSTAYDYLYVTVRDSSGNFLAYAATLSNVDKTTGYVQKTFNLSPYIGQTIRIRFGATTNSSNTTTFRIDDVSVIATVPAPIQTWTVTPSAGAGGNISPSSGQTVNNGSTTTFAVTPNYGYAASVSGTCGGSLSGTTYTTNVITTNCTVSAIFTVIPVLVNGVCGSSNFGTFSTAPSANLCSSGTATSVNGSGPWYWSCNGFNGGASNSCSANIQTWTVTPSAGAGGSISPSSARTVNYGYTTTFTVTPNNGYAASVNGTCGGYLSGNTYTTNAITTNCTVSATFTASPINGVCGASNGGTFTAAPTTNLCSSGTATTVSGSGPWSWSCSGSSGGAAANCSATNATQAAPAITSAGTANGTINVAFSYPITATNSPTSYGANGLPAGLNVNTSSGLISGTPSASGTFNATVTATNTVGTGSLPVTIAIATGTPTATLYPTLSSPISVAADGGQQPRIKKWGSNVYILNGGANQNLFFYKSTDNGTTFASTVLATPVLNSYEYEFCMDTNGYLYALWESSSDSQLYIRRSLDGGTTWSAAASIASGFVWMDQPSCTFSNGSLYLIFRGYQNAKNEFYLTKSSDSGSTFSTPVQVTNNSTQEDGGKIAVYGNNVYAIYYDGYSTSPNNIYLATSLNGGASFGSPVQVNKTTGKSGWGPAVAVDGLGNLFVAYSDTTTDGEGDLYVATSSNGGGSFTHTLAADSNYRNQDYPKMFVDGNNNLHLLWNDNRDNKSYGSVYYARSINGGTSYEANVSIDSLGGISNGSLYVDSDVVYLAVTDYKTTPYTTIFKKITWVSAPYEPTIGTATGGNAQATVNFTAPANDGGSPITGYTVTSSPGGFTATGTTSPITVTGLTNGTAYTFTVTATNSIGTGDASAASNAVTPSAPVVSLSLLPSSLTFTSQTQGTTSAAQTVTLSNTSSALLNITSIIASGDFAATSNCGTSLAAGANCAISVTFTPTAAGTRTGTLTITSNASGSPHTVSLSGTGVAVSIVTPSSGTNGSISPNAAQTVIYNGNTSFTITPNAGYTASVGGTCGGSLVGTTYTTNAITFDCTVTATFTDTAAPTGSITINSGTTYINTNSVTLTLTCTDAGSGCAQMQFSNDNSTWSTAEAYATSKAWTLSSGDGTKTVYVKFKDTAGNWSSAYNSTIALDTTSPTTTASPAGGTYTSAQSVTLTCSDGSGSGCDKIYYTTDGTTPTSFSTVYSDPISISATTTLQFFAKDMAGNSEAVKTENYVRTYSVIASAGVGGAIAPMGTVTVTHGSTAVFTVTPDTGYHISSVTGCGGTLSGDTYTVGAVTADCAVSATFAVDTFAVNFVSGSNGTLTGTASQAINYGGSATAVTAVPSTGYHFVNWTGTGGFVTTTSNPLTVTNVTAAQTITANFAIDTFAVTPMAGAGGTITPSTPQTLNYNGTTAFTVTPDTGYNINAVTGCGGTLTGNTYTTGAITGDCTVTASFIDVAQPVMTLSTLSDGAVTNNATLNISGTVTDNTGVQGLTVNGNAVTVNADDTFSHALILNEGANAITTIATDIAGNEITDTRIITLDTTAPALNISTPADNSKTAVSVATVTGTIGENSSVTVTLNSGMPQYASITGNTFTLDIVLASGVNTIEITATDTAGNTSTQKRTVTYDNTKPSLEITEPSQDTRTNLNSIIIRGNVSDTLTAVSVSVTVDGNTYTPTLTNGQFEQAVSFMEEKTYTIAVTATDEAGNETTVQRNIIYDITQPTIDFTVMTPTNTNSQTITGTMEEGSTVIVISATATIGTVTYPSTTRWSVNITGMTEGNNTITAMSKDIAGNEATVAKQIVVDTIAPATTASPAAGTYTSGQSVTLTANETATIYYTTDGSTPSTVYTTPITVSSTTTLKYFAVDLAGNSETVKSVSYTIDTVQPAFTSTAPATNSYINTVTVGYTLSEAVATGKITFARTGGSTDSGSHIYNFTDSDKTVGTHSVNTGLSLINAGTYTVTFEATDLAGNGATPVSSTNITYDTSSASVTINSPASGSITNNANVGYTLSEDISTGDIAFTRTGGTADGLSPQKYTLAVSERTSGSHTINTGVTLIDSAIYTVGFENVTDKAGNATASVSNTSIMYDSTAVAITNTSPASNTIITNSTVGYTLSEAALSGKVTFTRSGGNADASSPHVYTLSGSDLYLGSHTVNTNLSLVDGAFYTVSFDATDYAGNPATTVSNAMVYYDTNYGIGPSGNADNTGYSINRVDGFDLIKLSIAFGSKPGDANWNPVCDLDKNGKVDGSDLITLGAHFGEVQ